MTPSLGLVPGRGTYRHNLCGPAAAGEILSSEALYMYINYHLRVPIEKAFD